MPGAPKTQSAGNSVPSTLQKIVSHKSWPLAIGSIATFFTIWLFASENELDAALCSAGLCAVIVIRSCLSATWKQTPVRTDFWWFVTAYSLAMLGIAVDRRMASSGDLESLKLGAANLFYYATTTFTTVGYGDYSPKSRVARVITAISMLTFWIRVMRSPNKDIFKEFWDVAGWSGGKKK